MYIWPDDPSVQAKLEDWQDLKFGLLMHWGLYAQLGIVESWALCSEDQPFQDRGGRPYVEFKEMYFGLIEQFNPRQFDPTPWARGLSSLKGPWPRSPPPDTAPAMRVSRAAICRRARASRSCSPCR